ncbi:MAG: polysaccharide biosynthesis tyrosine autokinase [Planctomycetes bacterium]|nr:polysaccharide biosynthesis tyrosine autokinase [Planctomycetota bacterium]
MATEDTSDIYAAYGYDPTAISPAVQHIRGVVRTLWQRRWSAFTFLLIVMTIVSVSTFSKDTVYKAATLLRINKDNLKVLSFEEFVSTDESTDELIRTEVEVIRSLGLAEEVAAVLNLSANAEFQNELHPGILGGIIGRIKGADTPDDLDRNDKHLKAAAVARLLEMIHIDSIRGSRLVKLSVYSHSSRLAAEIANTWSEIYIRRGIDSKMQASRRASDMLAKQIDDQETIVEKTEKQLHEYTRMHGIYSYDDMKENINQRISELNTLLTKAKTDRIEKQAALQAMQSDPLGSEVAIKDPVVQKLQEGIARLEGDYSDMLEVFKPQYPECTRLRARIDQIGRTIKKQTRQWLAAAATDCTVAEQRVAAIQAELTKQQEQATRLQDVAVNYNALTRELETTTEHYRALLARRKEALSSMQIKESNVSVVDRARVPGRPHSPRHALNLILALVLGTALACGTCLGLEYLDSSVRTPDDIEIELGETLLGMVPEIEEDDEAGSDSKDLVSHLDGRSTVSEAYRTIRTSLAFSSRHGDMKNIVISSAVPGEGKTITAINIATVLGQVGEKVLLVDADMRRPRLHRSLHLPNNRGLSTYLVGQCELDEIIMATCLPNVDIIVSGPTPPNPSELLESHNMTELLAQCRQRYDRVIIDTPPVMAVTDSRLTAAKADGIIHVIRAGKTEKRCVRLAKKHFDSVGARVIGAVLNDVETESGTYTHYYYYRPYSN